jgi:rubrerythrin
MKHWTLHDIPWQQFDSSKTTPSLIAAIKAASMVEYNGYDYARYLCEIFHDDEEFKTAVHQWAEEEVQHGAALRKWSELADPAFDFDWSFTRFTNGYKLPLDVNQSVRGSRSGELIARCVVETGTSSYYTAIKNSTDEPVLQIVCARIAADEFRHYKLFYMHLKRYLEQEHIGSWQRLRIALSRISESEDDELAYAYYAANTDADTIYNHNHYKNEYMKAAYQFYHPHDIDKMVAMVMKAVGFTPGGTLQTVFNKAAWGAMQYQAKRAAKAA